MQRVADIGFIRVEPYDFLSRADALAAGLAATGQFVTEVSARTCTVVTERPSTDAPEAVTVDDAVWATLPFDSGARGSLEVSRVAAGRKNARSVELFGSTGALRFDLEELNELWFLDATEPIETQGFRRILVTEPEHP